MLCKSNAASYAYGSFDFHYQQTHSTSMSAFIIFNILIIGFLYWTLTRPELLLAPGAKRKIVTAFALLFVIIPILSAWEGENVLYLLFVGYPLLYAIVLRNRIRNSVAPENRSQTYIFFATFFLLLAAEIPVATGYIMSGYGPNGLTEAHYSGVASILKHLILYTGFYIGIALTLLFFYRRWRFTPIQVFTIGGLWGLLIEQGFYGSKLLLSGTLTDFIAFASFTFPTYGLYLAGPLLLFYEEFHLAPSTSRWQSVALFLAIASIPLITWALWEALLGATPLDLSEVI